MQMGELMRNARANALRSTPGTNPHFHAYTGSPPATCADTATGTEMYNFSLYTSWLNYASGGATGLTGSVTGHAIAAGDLGYWRLTNSPGTVCHLQGTFSLSGGGGDIIVDDLTRAVGQNLVFDQWDWVEPYA